MNPDVARRIYEAYLAIVDMPLRDGIRREMLTWALTENAHHWPVIGTTERALDRFSEHGFQCVSRMGVHRAHLIDRKTWQSAMLQTKLPFDDWLDFYHRSDRTILATSSENMKGALPDYLPIPTELGLFRSTGYKWRHSLAERAFLRDLHASRRGVGA